MTICAKCKYHNTKRAKSQVWYDHVCTHSSVRIARSVDPVTGDLLPGPHDLFPVCRDVNKGDCEHYKKKGLL